MVVVLYNCAMFVCEHTVPLDVCGGVTTVLCVCVCVCVCVNILYLLMCVVV